MSEHERRLISIKEACARVGVSRRTIYNWIYAGKVEYVRTAGGPVRIQIESLFRHANGDPITPRYPSRFV